MKKNLIPAILIAIFLLPACNKGFLNREPQDALSNATLWQSAADANAALVGVYSGQPDYEYYSGNGWASGSEVAFFDCMSDNAYSQYPWDGIQYFGNGSINPTSTSGDAANLWD